jgi:hypothetical protein
VPDTFLGLAALIFLFVPGVVYAVQADLRRPAIEQSPLRELTTIAGVGTICDVAVLTLFGIFHAICPDLTPDIGKLERSGAPYARSHLVTLSWWVIGLFVVSCLLAWLLGRTWPDIANRYIARRIDPESAWHLLFAKTDPDALVYVGCDLIDGTFIGGYLFSYNPDPDETEDRELVLSDPITYRPIGSETATELSQVGAMSIRAGRIRNVAVSFLDPSAHPEAATRARLAKARNTRSGSAGLRKVRFGQKHKDAPPA